MGQNKTSAMMEIIWQLRTAVLELCAKVEQFKKVEYLKRPTAYAIMPVGKKQ